jgi:hypothetical protein
MSDKDFSGRLLVPVMARPRRPLSSSALEQALEAVVTVDDATVQIVQIRGREAATVERHQRAQIRRQHRQHGHHHPFRTVARIDEGFDQLEPL